MHSRSSRTACILCDIIETHSACRQPLMRHRTHSEKPPGRRHLSHTDGRHAAEAGHLLLLSLLLGPATAPNQGRRRSPAPVLHTADSTCTPAAPWEGPWL